MIPSGEIARAFFISLSIARRLASSGFLSKSGSRYPICAVDMIPIPPSRATEPASLPRLTPTPIPPWIRGTLVIFSPILRFFIFFLYFHTHDVLDPAESLVSLLCQLRRIHLCISL